MNPNYYFKYLIYKRKILKLKEPINESTYYNKYLNTKKKYLMMKEMIGGKLYHRTIQNPPSTPWLDWIEQGLKKYEGRLNRGVWSELKIGDVIVWDDQKGKTLKTKVTELKYYPDFGAAFRDLGSELVPINDITESAVKSLYAKYFSDSEIRKHGSIAIGLQVLE